MNIFFIIIPIVIILIFLVIFVGLPLKNNPSSDPINNPSSDPINDTDTTCTNDNRDCFIGSFTHTSKWNGETIQGTVEISGNSDGTLGIISNNIPAHDITFDNCTANVCEFANGYATGSNDFTIPEPSEQTYFTELSQNRNDGIMLDGVVIDLFSGGCYDPNDYFSTESFGGEHHGGGSGHSSGSSDEFGNKKVGCFGDGVENYYLLDPAYEQNGFAVDDHNAHTQEGGEYHYHADPYPEKAEVSAESTPQVIGFAADGFPIYEKWENAKSCYVLKSSRNTITDGYPVPPVDDDHPLGMYIDDYEYVSSSTCTLDEANGMEVDGNYGYYVTADYPYIIRKLKGEPHESFCKKGTDDAGECK